MTRTPLFLLALAACSLRPYDFGASATDTGGDTSTTSTSDPTTGAPPITTGPPGTTTSPATTDATGSSTGWTFVMESDWGIREECDTWVEDCPEDMKCMPYSGDGDNSWESLKCVPLVPNPGGLGDPCMVIDGLVSGKDTCDKHMMCWNVDPETSAGTCVGKCLGSPDMPHCEDPSATCLLSGDGVLTLCLGNCDPLLQDCPKPTDECIPNPQDPNSFICVLDASGEQGQAFDPCEYANACDPGLICANTELAAECDPMAGAGCCLPFCDITGPLCPGKDQQCLPWYEMGQAPPGYENVGVCGLPQP